MIQNAFITRKGWMAGQSMNMVSTTTIWTVMTSLVVVDLGSYYFKISNLVLETGILIWNFPRMVWHFQWFIRRHWNQQGLPGRKKSVALIDHQKYPHIMLHADENLIPLKQHGWWIIPAKGWEKGMIKVIISAHWHSDMKYLYIYILIICFGTGV